MFVYNTFTKTREKFEPTDASKVKMYVCGITPYNHCHIGHARCYVAFDTIRRYLTFKGYKVHYIQNFTDIDDKIINAANAEKIEPLKLADKYIESYFEDIRQLNVLDADYYPRVSENIDEIIEFIKKIIDNGFGYVIDGEVFFDVEKFKNYGRLSNRNLSEQKAGARVKTDEKKRNPLDFTLWKPAKPNEPYWQSPWSNGRPGWHIECSVMSLKYFNDDTIDIHGGGMDLIFQHHENEIAQSEAALNKQFVKYWLHNGFVTINKEKMSKSLNNFFLIKDILKKYNPQVLRYFLISSHYRSPLDFSDEHLEASKSAFEKLKNFLFELESTKCDIVDVENHEFYNQSIKNIQLAFIETMDDDFNTAGALAALHTFIHTIQKKTAASYISQDLKSLIKSEFLNYCAILGLQPQDLHSNQDKHLKKIDEIMKILLNVRTTVRIEKQFKLADFIRAELEKIGIEIRDTKEGTKYIIKD